MIFFCYSHEYIFNVNEPTISKLDSNRITSNSKTLIVPSSGNVVKNFYKCTDSAIAKLQGCYICIGQVGTEIFVAIEKGSDLILPLSSPFLLSALYTFRCSCISLMLQVGSQLCSSISGFETLPNLFCFLLLAGQLQVHLQSWMLGIKLSLCPTASLDSEEPPLSTVSKLTLFPLLNLSPQLIDWNDG